MAIETLEVAEKFLEERPVEYRDFARLEAVRNEEIEFLKCEVTAEEALLTKEEVYVEHLQRSKDLQ